MMPFSNQSRRIDELEKRLDGLEQTVLGLVRVGGAIRDGNAQLKRIADAQERAHPPSRFPFSVRIIVGKPTNER